GLKSGDIIIGIDGEQINSVSRLQELVARKRRGDKVDVKFLRGGEESEVTATLKNISGTTKIVKREEPKKAEFESVTFEDVEVSVKQRLRIDGGAVITGIDNEKWEDAGAKE